MILGYYGPNRRPTVNALVLIPTKDPEGKDRQVSAIVPFVIDTGADLTVLCPHDYEYRLRLPILRAKRGTPVQGIGGAIPTRNTPGLLYFAHRPDPSHPGSTGLSAFTLTFTIPELTTGQPLQTESLLGRDVLGETTIVLNRSSTVLSLELPRLI